MGYRIAISVFLVALGGVSACNLFFRYPIAVPADPLGDKDSLASMAIARAVISHRDIPDFSLLSTTPAIIVESECEFVTLAGDTLTDSITVHSLPHDRSVNFALLTPAQIQKEADDHSDFVYLSVFRIRMSAQGAFVSVATTWAVGKDSRVVILSGGGYVLRFSKDGGSWMFEEVVAEWIS